MTKYKFDEIVSVNGQKMTKAYIETLNYSQREALIEPLAEIIAEIGIPYPDDEALINKEWERVKACEINIENMEAYNNSSVGGYLCKYFCAEKFYDTTEPGKKTLKQLLLNNPDLHKRMAKNRLGMDWLLSSTDKSGKVLPGVNQAFNLSPKMLVLQCARSMRLINNTTLFKADVSKLLVSKYSQPNDLVYDYSAGFGARMLGTIAAGRKYTATDPLTIPELNKMKDYLKLENVRLIQDGSENANNYLKENSVDFIFSSPPYLLKKGKKMVAQEEYAKENQAYSLGLDNFYDVYWKKTLQNCKSFLKPGKWFGLNTSIKEERMVDMARELFGKEKEIFKLRTVKSHLSGKSKDKNNSQKFEPIYMFLNNK